MTEQCPACNGAIREYDVTSPWLPVHRACWDVHSDRGDLLISRSEYDALLRITRAAKWHYERTTGRSDARHEVGVALRDYWSDVVEPTP